jgi:GNAT superfamily N-acetyltransferase
MRFVLDPPLTPELREEIVELWVSVSNAGGAVGFAGSVTDGDVWPVANRAFAGLAEGHDHLLAGYQDERLAAMLLFINHRFALAAHWRTVKRVMVRPSLQGKGFGGDLIREAEAVARRFGWEALHVTIRDGTGLEGFYAAHGYREVGRLPGALRVGPGDDRDEAHMWLTLG